MLRVTWNTLVPHGGAGRGGGGGAQNRLKDRLRLFCASSRHHG